MKKITAYEGIENENPNEIGYQLDDWAIDRFLELKEELLETDNQERAAEIRKEMADILGDEYKNKVVAKNEEEHEEDVPAKVGILKSDIEAIMLEYTEKQREMLTYLDGEDTMSDKDKREYERINNVTPILKQLLTKNPDLEYVSIEDFDNMIEEYTDLRRGIWQDVVNSGVEATSKEESDLRKYDDIVNELQGLRERCKTIEEKAPVNDLYNGVENENPHAIYYQLDDWEKDKFLELKDELLETDDLQRAAEIRKEMADILGDEYKNKVATKAKEQEVQDAKKAEDNDKAKSGQKQEKDSEKAKAPEPGPEKDSDFYPPALVPGPTKDSGFYPPAPLNLPQLNVTLNVKTGECVLTDGTEDEKGNLNQYKIKMNSALYAKNKLKSFRQKIGNYYNIPKEDMKYLEAVDPTLYSAYMKWGMANEGKYLQSPDELYVKSVIEREKQLENGQKPHGEKVPGNVKISYKKPSKKENPNKNNFKGVSGLLAMARAKKLLNHHDSKGLDLAEVEKEKGLFKKLLPWLIVGGGAVALLTGSNHENEPKPKTQIETETEKDTEKDTEIEIPGVEKTLEHEDDGKEENTENIQNIENQRRIYVGDIVDIEEYSALYKSADAAEQNGVVNIASQTYGVNKIACVIDGQTYSTATHSADEIYEMAEKAGVKVDYHIDKAAIINGKACVQVHEVGKAVDSFITRNNETGRTEYIDGSEFKGDVKDGVGWMKDGIKGVKETTIQKVIENNKDSNSQKQHDITKDVNEK